MFAAKTKDTKNLIQDPGWNRWGTGFGEVPGHGVYASSATQLLTVYGCVTRIAGTIAMMPVDHYTRFGGQQATNPLRATWLDKPNADSSWSTFVKQYVWSLLVDGNVFIAVLRNPAGRVTEIWILDPTTVALNRVRPGAPISVLVNGVPFLGELLHVPAFMLPGAIRGINPIENARVALSVGLSAQEYGAGFFNNSGVPAIVIKAKGEVTPQQREDLRDGWNGIHRGPTKSSGVGILGGDADIAQLTISPEQAQFLETRRFSSAEISANLFKVPPHFSGVAIDGSSLTYQTLIDLYDDLIKSACMPIMKDLEDVISLNLLPQPQYIKLNADVWLRAQAHTRYVTHKVGITGGFLTPNEARDLEDLPPMPGGDVLSSPLLGGGGDSVSNKP